MTAALLRFEVRQHTLPVIWWAVFAGVLILIGYVVSITPVGFLSLAMCATWAMSPYRRAAVWTGHFPVSARHLWMARSARAGILVLSTWACLSAGTALRGALVESWRFLVAGLAVALLLFLLAQNWRIETFETVPPKLWLIAQALAVIPLTVLAATLQSRWYFYPAEAQELLRWTPWLIAAVCGGAMLTIARLPKSFQLGPSSNSGASDFVHWIYPVVLFIADGSFAVMIATPAMAASAAKPLTCPDPLRHLPRDPRRLFAQRAIPRLALAVGLYAALSFRGIEAAALGLCIYIACWAAVTIALLEGRWSWLLAGAAAGAVSWFVASWPFAIVLTALAYFVVQEAYVQRNSD